MENLTKEQKKKMYNFLFHYNEYSDQWACFNREDYPNYFNGTKLTYPIGRGKTILEALEDKKNG
tara:strand:+ start:22290 stop:22481 length:192 start_codon:yes stop_codon:yes gene_type:complete